MPNLTDLEIRNGILSTIEPNVGDAVLLNRWILGLGLGESIPYMKNADGKIHAYMVSRSSIGSSPNGIGSKKFDLVYTYKLWGFQGLRIGNNLSNSEDEFSAEVDAVMMKFMEKPRLAWDDLDYNFKRHDNWQINDIDIYDFGNEKVHVAQGTLEIVLTVQAV